EVDEGFAQLRSIDRIQRPAFRRYVKDNRAVKDWHGCLDTIRADDQVSVCVRPHLHSHAGPDTARRLPVSDHIYPYGFAAGVVRVQHPGSIRAEHHAQTKPGIKTAGVAM